MSKPANFLIFDGYPQASRDEFQKNGASLAGDLYSNMLIAHLPSAKFNVVHPSDDGFKVPSDSDLTQYSAILWTGCNLSIHDGSDARVLRQLDIAETAYKLGIPAFGSCWGLQIAVVAAGGEVQPNPKGKEMGVARKITLTGHGRNHPMYGGKATVFDGLISHDDMVTKMPSGVGVQALVLSGNSFTDVQSVDITCGKGRFWATQYHCEYNVYEIARLTATREQILINLGFFKNSADAQSYIGKMEELSGKPDSKDLRWLLGIDDDVLDPACRQIEFANWLQHQVN